VNTAQTGKMLLLAGRLIAAFGAILWLGSRFKWLRLGRLPGDIAIEREGFSLFFPVTTMILVSVIVSGLLLLLGFFRR
jgi:hypothetical protein